MSVAARVRVAGPLTRYIEGFAAELTAHGYTDLSLANQLRLMADLSRWLQATRTPVDEIDHDVVDRFLTKRRQTHTQFFSKRALAPLLRYLETVGAVSLTAVEQRPLGQLLREYERYLVEERAVLPARRQLCVAVAAAFIDGKRVAGLTAKDVTRFVDARAGRPGLAGVLGALRSVLRFLFVASKTRLNLVAAVPAMPRWRLGRLGCALARLPRFSSTILIGRPVSSSFGARAECSAGCPSPSMLVRPWWPASVEPRATRPRVQRSCALARHTMRSRRGRSSGSRRRRCARPGLRAAARTVFATPRRRRCCAVAHR